MTEEVRINPNTVRAAESLLVNCPHCGQVVRIHGKLQFAPRNQRGVEMVYASSECTCGIVVTPRLFDNELSPNPAREVVSRAESGPPQPS